MQRWGQRVLIMIVGFLFGMTFPFSLTFAGDAAKGDAAKGKAIYEGKGACAACHGTSGKGDGPGAAALPVKPKDHTDSASMSQLTDDYLFKIIRQGGVAVGKSPLMTGAPTLNDEETWDVVAYVRSLSKK